MKSFKTSLWGIIGGLGMIATQVYYIFDGDPATTFSTAVIIAALAAMGIGINARDNDVTSEKAGAR